MVTWFLKNVDNEYPRGVNLRLFSLSDQRGFVLIRIASASRRNKYDISNKNITLKILHSVWRVMYII